MCDLALSSQESYPRATQLLLRRGWLRRQYALVSWKDVASVDGGFDLSVGAEELAFGPSKPACDLTLVRDILDQQVVDTDGQKVIRVNDVRMLKLGTELRLHHVDVGLRGIVRRLGWQWWVDPMASLFLARTEYLKDALIQWSLVQPLAMNVQKGTLKLTVNQKQLALIPQPDFGDIMETLDVYRRTALFKSIAAELRPKVFSELPLNIQKELLENMDLQEAADLLSRVPANQTVDLIEDLPKSVADSLLALMENSTARRLSTLLGYTSDSAGGLMTTEFLAMPHDTLAGAALQRVRQSPEALDTIHFIFLLEGEGRLAGQVPLKRLLLASPDDPLAQYALHKPVYVRAKDSFREVAYVMEKYKLPSIPVVDNGRDRRLQGVITLDEILARLIPLAWRRRLRVTRASAPPASA